MLNKRTHTMNNNKVLSNKFALQIATMLSAIMLAALAMPSLAPTKAFAQEQLPDARNLLGEVNRDSTTQAETSYSEGRDNGVDVDPIIQTSVQPNLNVHTDVDIIFDEADCQDASDDVNQENIQTSDQQGRSEGEVGDNSVYVSPKVETAVQSGLNVAVTPDVVLTDECDPADQINQGHVQSTNQQGGSNLEEGEGSMVVDPTHATSIQNARNVAIDPNYYADLPL